MKARPKNRCSLCSSFVLTFRLVLIFEYSVTTPNAHVPRHVYKNICICKCIVKIYVHVYVYVCIYIYIYIHKYICTYIHIVFIF
jgi:hypothetical protein